MSVRDLHGVLVFREVARTGGFSSAARRMNVTPAAVSRTISKLEGELGIRLFNRTTSEFRLTPEGRRLAEAIGDHLDGVYAVLEDLGARQDLSGKVRVSLTNSYGKFYVIPRLPLFLEKY